MAVASLPIEPLLPQLLETLRVHGRLVLQAPPGAGKTTRVPLALAAAEPWSQGRVLVLEPRRLAAKLAARQMARSLGEAVGETVGYRVRLDSCVGPNTRVELVTDGLFLRLLQEDPALSGVSAVLFDEVHERGIGSDLALALTWQARQLLVPDLAVVAMSATLDAEPLARLLDNAPVLSSEGRAFPVETIYAERPAPDQPSPRAIADQVRPAIREALATQQGSVLVFLPGQAEIRRLMEQLQDALPADVELTPLFGDLDARAQDAAVAAAAPGRRKVVLATALAESSLTIDGIEVVIDAGWSRVSRFDPSTGLARLLTEKLLWPKPISAAAARVAWGQVFAGGCGPLSISSAGRCNPSPKFSVVIPLRWPWSWPFGVQRKARSWRSLIRRPQALCSRPACCCRSWAPCFPMANPPLAAAPWRPWACTRVWGPWCCAPLIWSCRPPTWACRHCHPSSGRPWRV